MLEHGEDDRVFLRQLADLHLCLDEAAVQRSGEVSGVKGEDVFADLETACRLVGAYFDGDEGAGERFPVKDRQRGIRQKCSLKAAYSGGNLSGEEGGAMADRALLERVPIDEEAAEERIRGEV